LYNRGHLYGLRSCPKYNEHSEFRCHDQATFERMDLLHIPDGTERNTLP
jgi:hypothetical protein